MVLAKVSAPVMPYMSELIYSNLNKNPDLISVHLAKWPEKKELTYEQKNILSQMGVVRETVEQGHSFRKSANIKLRQPLGPSHYYFPSGNLDKQFEEILAEELNVESISASPSPSPSPGPDDRPRVELNTNITPELKKAGLARELERAVQDMRKKHGFKVGEQVNLSYDTDDEELQAALKLFDTKKTYVGKILHEKGGEQHEIDGKKITLNLVRI
jgi:valyl-tRNA synthetase